MKELKLKLSINANKFPINNENRPINAYLKRIILFINEKKTEPNVVDPRICLFIKFNAHI